MRFSSIANSLVNGPSGNVQPFPDSKDSGNSTCSRANTERISASSKTDEMNFSYSIIFSVSLEAFDSLKAKATSADESMQAMFIYCDLQEIVLRHQSDAHLI